MKKILIILTLLIMFLPIVIAQPAFVFQQNQAIDIKISCFDNDKAFCDSVTNCTMTITKPDSSLLINNSPMTRNPSYYNLSIGANVLDSLGEYDTIMQCIGSSDNGFERFTFDVTSSGEKDTQDSSSSLAIVIFILMIAGGLILASLKKEWLHNEYLNFVLRRSFLVITIYLMILNSTIVATIAASANLPLTNEMFTYMTLFGYAGYISMIVLVFMSILHLMKQWKTKKEEERFGV